MKQTKHGINAVAWFYNTSFHSNLPTPDPVQTPPAVRWESVDRWDAEADKWVTVVYKRLPDGSFEVRK